MAYSVTTALHSVAKQYVNAAKSWADTTDGVNDTASTSTIINMLDTYVSILKSSQSNPTLNKINYTPYINQVLALYPPEELILNSKFSGTFVGSSKLFKITNSTFTGGDIFGFIARDVKSFQVLDSNKKVIAQSKTGDLDTVGLKLPEKFKGGDLYLKIFGATGSDYAQFVYEINDPASTDIQAGGNVSASIQFTGDRDIYKLNDTAGFTPITQSGAGEWQVKIESSNISNLSAKLTGTTGVKAETFKLEGSALVADITRINPKTLSKAFTLEVGSTKGTIIGVDDIYYTVSFLSDDYAANKKTSALIDLKTNTSGSLSGKFSWVNDVDWVKVVIGSVTNKTAGDTYSISGLSTTASTSLYDTNGKLIQDISNNQFAVKAAGTYYLQLTDHSAAADTHYTMNVGLVGATSTPAETVV